MKFYDTRCANISVILPQPRDCVLVLRRTCSSRSADACLGNYLLRGEAFANALHDLPSIHRVPHEFVTTDGLLIDETEKVVWRWHVGRVQAIEKILKKAWKGWSFREIPGGNWAGQLQLSGREAAGLACPERKILGLVVAEHAPYAAQDAGEPGLVGLISMARKGCWAITVLFGLAAVAIYALSQSVGFAIALGVLFLLCLAATVVVFKKTGKVIRTLDLDISPAESNAKMDQLLKGLGYPSIEELNANGELPVDREEVDEEDEDEN